MTSPHLSNDSTGLHVLSQQLKAPPKLVLSFYDYGVMMRRIADDGSTTEYPVSPAQISTALSARIQFSSGILSENTIYLSSVGVSRLVVEYRKPQKTIVLLDGSDAALETPLPGLLLIRATNGGDRPRYAIYAVKQRPAALDAVLYHCPLPNTSLDGICWGNVQKASAASLAGNNLTEDWQLLFGSMFTNHSCNGKSKSHPKDIRLKLLELEKQKSRVYPTRDLVPANLKLSDILERLSK